MVYHWYMGRKDVLVQLDEDLVTRRDGLAAAAKTSRSALLRRGALAVLEVLNSITKDVLFGSMDQ